MLPRPICAKEPSNPTDRGREGGVSVSSDLGPCSRATRARDGLSVGAYRESKPSPAGPSGRRSRRTGKPASGSARDVSRRPGMGRHVRLRRRRSCRASRRRAPVESSKVRRELGLTVRRGARPESPATPNPRRCRICDLAPSSTPTTVPCDRPPPPRDGLICYGRMRAAREVKHAGQSQEREQQRRTTMHVHVLPPCARAQAERRLGWSVVGGGAEPHRPQRPGESTDVKAPARPIARGGRHPRHHLTVRRCMHAARKGRARDGAAGRSIRARLRPIPPAAKVVACVPAASSARTMAGLSPPSTPTPPRIRRAPTRGGRRPLEGWGPGAGPPLVPRSSPAVLSPRLRSAATPVGRAKTTTEFECLYSAPPYVAPGDSTAPGLGVDRPAGELGAATWDPARRSVEQPSGYCPTGQGRGRREFRSRRERLRRLDHIEDRTSTDGRRERKKERTGKRTGAELRMPWNIIPGTVTAD